jgi:Polyketide cyclase / dehydrase and lipid transport
MGPVSATVSIDAPRERVHPLLADLAVRPAFTDHFIDEFRLERLDSTGVGAAARFRIRERRLWMETVIAESAPPYRLAERGAGGRLDRMPVHTVWELVEAAVPSGCEVTVTFVIEETGPFDRPGHERWYRRQWGRALGRLRDLAESDARPPRLAVAGVDRLGA